MRPKRMVQWTLVAVVLSLGVAGSVWAAQPCGLTSPRGKVIAVTRTGSNDTTNLQCALDLAVKAGRGSIILGRGKFYTAQLVATNFKGMIRGEGIKHTILQNVPKPLFVTPDNSMLIGPPSAANPWPSLLAFVNGDIAVRDLAIRITGAEPTTPWSLSLVGAVGPFKVLAHAIVVVGTHADVRVSRVSISGEPSKTDTLFGLNLYNGIFFEGALGAFPPPPLSGSYEVRDSRFSTLVSGTPVLNLKDATVLVENNTFDGVVLMADVGDVTSTNLRFVSNTANFIQTGISLYNGGVQSDGLTNSRLFIANNTFRGDGPGVDIQSTFGGKNSCLLVLNDTTRVTNLPAIVLGAETKDCLVITTRQEPLPIRARETGSLPCRADDGILPSLTRFGRSGTAAPKIGPPPPTACRSASTSRSAPSALI